MAISGISRSQHVGFDDPKEVMEKFAVWVKENSRGKPIFISDNPVYDWQWINYYFHTYLGSNPFGYSARRIGDLYCGMKLNMFEKWKHLRKTEPDHNPVTDAIGNAEALLAMREMGLNVPIK